MFLPDINLWLALAFQSHVHHAADHPLIGPGRRWAQDGDGLRSPRRPGHRDDALAASSLHGLDVRTLPTSAARSVPASIRPHPAIPPAPISAGPASCLIRVDPCSSVAPNPERAYRPPSPREPARSPIRIIRAHSWFKDPAGPAREAARSANSLVGSGRSPRRGSAETRRRGIDRRMACRVCPRML